MNNKSESNPSSNIWTKATHFKAIFPLIEGGFKTNTNFPDPKADQAGAKRRQDP